MEGAAAVVIVTEWDEFRLLDLARVRGLLRQPPVVDFRNFYVPDEMAAAGVVCHRIGRPGAPRVAYCW